MAQRQAKVTDFFQHRRKSIQSPSAKRVKFEETTSAVIQTEEKVWSLPPSTPNVTIVARPTDLSAKKRKNGAKSPVGETVIFSAPKSSGARRQLKFTKARRRLSGDKTEDDTNDVVASLKFHTLEPSASTISPVKNITTPTKFSIDDVRKNLGKVRNLQDLRQRLATFSETAARLNDLVDARNVEISKIPDSTTCKAGSTAAEIEDKEKTPKNFDEVDKEYIPAYQRYAHLVSNNFNANLELPVARKVLLDTFRAADQLVSIMYNRMELITFDKLKLGVQKMTRKNFEKQQLGQIKTVYPEAYSFEQMKISTKFGKADEFFLTIAPNLTTDLKSYQINTPSKTPMKRQQTASDSRTPPSSPAKDLAVIRSPYKTPLTSFRSPCKISSPQKTPNKSSNGSDRLKPMSGARLVCRAEIFKKNLLVLLNDEHNKFLATLSPPVILTADEQTSLQRWHPKFNLNSLPDVVASELPQPPYVEKIYTAKEVLEKQKSKEIFPIEVANALKKVSVDSPASSSIDAENTPGSKKSSLKGIPTNLLEKIRAKESLKIQRNLIRSPEEDLKRQRLSRLPEMIKILKMYFATENKMVIQQDLVAKKLHDSYKSLISNSEIDNHLKLLLEHASEWLTQTNVREKGVYLRVNKTCSVNEVLEKLTKMIDAFEK